MKTYLMAALLLAASTWTAQSQTKGTNAIGFGISSQHFKQESNNGGSAFDNEQKATSYSLTYGHFIKDNTRIGLTFSYSDGSFEYTGGGSSSSKGYGGIVHYQKYYPLLKKFYAYAGGRARYSYGKDEQDTQSSNPYRSENNLFGIGAHGGAAYFLSKRFAFEAQLLSADFTYARITNNSSDSKLTQTNVNISSSGAINNLGFSIYLLF